jgi:hypothetical protein
MANPFRNVADQITHADTKVLLAIFTAGIGYGAFISTSLALGHPKLAEGEILHEAYIELFASADYDGKPSRIPILDNSLPKGYDGSKPYIAVDDAIGAVEYLKPKNPSEIEDLSILENRLSAISTELKGTANIISRTILLAEAAGEVRDFNFGHGRDAEEIALTAISDILFATMAYTTALTLIPGNGQRARINGNYDDNQLHN